VFLVVGIPVTGAGKFHPPGLNMHFGRVKTEELNLIKKEKINK